MLRKSARGSDWAAKSIKDVVTDLHFLVERICPVREYIISVIMSRVTDLFEYGSV
jgi:hypothetical protein